MKCLGLVLLVGGLVLLPAARGDLVSPVLEPYADSVDVAVEAGLQYLVSRQEDSGFFPGSQGKTTGVVGLCGMAFLSKGYLPDDPRYGETIRRCIDYCLDHQETDNGYMGKVDGGKIYSHSIATLLLLEVSGMVDEERQERLDKAIPRAVKLLLAAQQVEKSESNTGGWRYQPHDTGSDLSCSSWAVMALRSARLNGVPVPDQSIEDAVSYVLRRQDKTEGCFGYTDTQSRKETLTGAGLLCLELLGHHGKEYTFRAGASILSTYKKLPHSNHFVYGLYYTAQATFQLGEKYWATFAPWMYEYCLPKQRDDGSWDGSPYKTAMTVLAFTVPYRQLPIYQRDETVDEELE